jgi:transposase
MATTYCLADLPMRGTRKLHPAQAQSRGLLLPLPQSFAQPCWAVLQKIKLCRRIATRQNKLAAKCFTFIKLASTRIWLRDYESTF